MVAVTVGMQPHIHASDPYRQLFDRLTAGAARCRMVIDGDRVVDIEVIESNPAFVAVRHVLPQLIDVFARARDGAAESLMVRIDHRTLSVSAYPSNADEVMVIIEDVSAREELEQRSKVSQTRFEQAFHGNAAAMVIAHQSDLRIIDVNPRWLEMFGATREEVIGRTSVELGLISEHDARARVAQHREFANGYEIELALRTRAGRPLTVLASAKPIVIAEGPCTLTTLLDITGRKHAEEAFALAFSASPAGMVLVHAASDTVVSVNRRFLEMTQFERDDFVGHKSSELDFIRAPSRAQLLDEIARSGRLDGTEVELRCRAGGGIWTLASTEMVTLHDNMHRLTVFTDIAGRKRFERRLLTQHAIGRTLAETSDVGVALPKVLAALCLGEGWNEGAVWLRGDDGALVGRWRSQVQHGPRLIGDDCALLGMVIATGEPAVESPGMVAFPVLRGTEVLGIVVLAGAREDTLDTAERGLLDSVGRLLGLFVERTRAEASLRELNIELERRVVQRTQALETTNRDLESFTSSVSHDLRAPLRTMHGFANILLEDFAADLPDEAKELLTSIHTSGERLRNLIDDLLAFSRLGRNGLKRTTIDLDAMVSSVVDELLSGRGLGDRVHITVATLGTCNADPSLLRAVWTNLIDNALKYSRTRERIEVTIGRESRAGETLYFIQDNGVGFDARYADRLFGVFQRLHAASEFEGTGVGLANVRRIVERHHGRIAASAVLDRGSRFEFTLGEEVR
jgi:PAS domain S-box-containing protein